MHREKLAYLGFTPDQAHSVVASVAANEPVAHGSAGVPPAREADETSTVP
jgi:hypothetical protein